MKIKHIYIVIFVLVILLASCKDLDVVDSIVNSKQIFVNEGDYSDLNTDFNIESGTSIYDTVSGLKYGYELYSESKVISIIITDGRTGKIRHYTLSDKDEIDLQVQLSDTIIVSMNENQTFLYEWKCKSDENINYEMFETIFEMPNKYRDSTGIDFTRTNFMFGSESIYDSSLFFEYVSSQGDEDIQFEFTLNIERELKEEVINHVSDLLVEYGVSERELEYPEFPELILELYEYGVLENYGGLYIDNSSYYASNLPNFVVVVKDMDATDVYLLQQLDYKGEFIIMSGEFSMKELEEVRDDIALRWSDLKHIGSVGISNDTNRVDLVVSEVSDELDEYISSLPNPDIVAITISDVEAVEDSN